MAGVSPTSSSPRLSPVPSIEEGRYGGAILHVAPSHETIKSHLFKGWTLAAISGSSPVIKATMQFKLERAPVREGTTPQQRAELEAQLQAEEAEGKITFKAYLRSNHVSRITHGANLDQRTFSMPSPLTTPSIRRQHLESSEVKLYECMVLDALSRDAGMEVSAIGSEELHLERGAIKLQFTAGIERSVIISPTAEEIAESHQKLTSLLQAKSSEQIAKRYGAICDLALACNKGGSFPPISNANLLGEWDLIAVGGVKPKDVVRYQWIGEEEGLLVLECLIAKGKQRTTASGGVLTSEKGSSFETSTDSYQKSSKGYRHRSNDGDWHQISHFLFNPPVAPDGYADDRTWKVVSFSDDHLLFSDTHFNTMLLTRKEKESGSAASKTTASKAAASKATASEAAASGAEASGAAASGAAASGAAASGAEASGAAPSGAAASGAEASGAAASGAEASGAAASGAEASGAEASEAEASEAAASGESASRTAVSRAVSRMSSRFGSLRKSFRKPSFKE